METSPTSNSGWFPIQLPLEFSPDVVHVIRIALDIPYEEWNALSRFLSADEKERAARFRFDDPRRRFIVCRSTLRQLLGVSCDIVPNDVRFRYGTHGKPDLSFEEMNAATPPIEFSVSHSGEIGLIAITLNAIVGIDVEEWNSKVNIKGLAERFFSRAEAVELSSLPEHEQMAGFYRGWTCKEAYIKATGRGMSLPLDSFIVTIDPRKHASFCHLDNQPDEPARWTIQSLDVSPGYSGAVMVARPSCRVACWNWPPF